jgi:hypothetical protein
MDSLKQIDVVSAEGISTNFIVLGLFAALAARDDSMWEVIKDAFDGADLLADSAALSGAFSPTISRLVHLNLEALRDLALRGTNSPVSAGLPSHDG